MDSALRLWLEHGFMAPSGDNCQPWDLDILQNQIRLSINPERARHFLDQNHAATWISLGAFCENLSLSAGHFGFKCTFEIETPLSVLIHYIPSPALSQMSLIESIEKRKTDRGPFQTLSEEDHHLEKQILESTGNKHFKWTYRPHVPVSLLARWSWLEMKVWLKTSMVQDFTRWVSFGKEPRPDGIPVENLKVSMVDAMMLKILKRFPRLVRWIPGPTFCVQTFFRLWSQIQHSSGIISITGPFGHHQDYFAAGRQIERMWIQLTERGYRAQPLSLQSLFFNYLSNSETANSFPASTLRRMQKIHARTLNDLGLHGNLIYMLRIGRSQSPIAAIHRRSVESALRPQVQTGESPNFKSNSMTAR